MRIGYRKLSVAVAAVAVLALAGSSLAATGKPSISGFTPGSAKVGATVTISGKNLSGATAVKIDGRKASFKVKSATRISAKVPSGAKTGKISVTTKKGTATSSKSLHVTVAVVVVTTPPVTTGGGLGSVTTNAPSIQNNSTGNTIAFTYTASAAITNGDVAIIVPGGWSLPITTSGAGCTSASVGQVSTAGYRIDVALSLAAGATTVITYGATSGGSCAAGDGALAGPNVGPIKFEAEEQTTAGGGIGFLSSSPIITEVAQTFAANGSGTLTSSVSTVAHGSTGNTFTFTYTAATGGLYNGQLTITLPANWTAPTTNAAIGCVAVSSNTGLGATTGQTITVSGINLLAGQTVTITYGAVTGDKCIAGDGATIGATATLGAQTLTAQEESTANNDTFVTLAASPVVTVT